MARHSLKSHHLSLLRRLTASLEALQESQAESLSVLPRSSPFKELPCYARCESVSDVVAIAAEKGSSFSIIPPVTLLRCGIIDYGKGKEKGKEKQQAKPSTEDLFRYLESQVPWLVSEEGLQYEVCMCVHFEPNGVILHQVENSKSCGTHFRHAHYSIIPFRGPRPIYITAQMGICLRIGSTCRPRLKAFLL